MQTILRPTGSDDTQLLRDAFERAEPYSTITLDGAFRVAGDCTVRKSNLAVLGYGAMLTQAAEHAKTLSLVGCSGVQIVGLTLRGCGLESPWHQHSTPYNGVAGLHLSTANDVLMRDCRLTNHAGGSVVLDGACSGIRILDNTIVGMGRDHIQPNDNGYDGAILGTANSIPKRRISIAGNDISGHAFGLLVPGEADMIVANNHIHDMPGQHGAYLMRGGNLEFADNIIDHCIGVGMKLQQQTAEDLYPVVTIHGNTVSDCGSFAIGLLTVGAGVGFTQRNVSVCNNNVARCGYPLYLRGLRGAMVAHNRGSQCDHAMVRVDCEDSTFADNLFLNCGA
jgi:nitrous oxidase accessory protein NosD